MRDGQFIGGREHSRHLRNRNEPWRAVRAWLRESFQIRNESVQMFASMREQKVTHNPQAIAADRRVQVRQGLCPAVKHLRAEQANLPELTPQEIIPTSKHRLFSGIPSPQGPA